MSVWAPTFLRRWKENYFVARGDWARVARAYCTLCERLHTDTTPKVYDLFDWFVSKSHCLSRSSPRVRAFIGGYRYSHYIAFLVSVVVLAAVVFAFVLTVLVAEFFRAQGRPSLSRRLARRGCV